MRLETLNVSKAANPLLSKSLLLPIAVYLIWIAATFLLEGRIHQMLRYDPLNRATYIIIANVFIGTILASWAIKVSLLSASNQKEKIGFRNPSYTIVAVIVSFILGIGLFLLQNPGSRDPILLLNIFSLALPVSIAEIMVCWALIGISFERLLQQRSKGISILAGILAADIFFAFYHFAHSPPFNQLSIVLFLLIPGLLTSLVYFIGRNLYAAIIIQNFLGMIGVSRNIDAPFYSQPLYPLYFLALVAILALLASDKFIIRKRDKGCSQGANPTYPEYV